MSSRLKEEFVKLLDQFKKGGEGKKIDMDEILVQSAVLFEELQKELKVASPEDRDAIYKMMNEMYEKIHEESKRICQQTGMTEEQLIAFSENPRNFSPDQWLKIQNTKKKMMQTSRVIGKVVKAEDDTNGSKKKVVRRPKKSEWLRS